MLNGKKILSVCGAVALLLGVGMNLRHSLNDYGMGTNSLSTFAWHRPVLLPDPDPVHRGVDGFGH